MAGGLRWWNGPDEDLGYVVAEAVPSLAQPNPLGASAGIGFWRSQEKTESSFIELVNRLPQRSGQSPFTSGASASAYLSGIGLWTSYSDIVTAGLLLNLDAGNPASYPGTGTAWTDLSGNGNNGVLTNGPTFNSANGGSIVFDGANDYVNVNSFANILPGNAYTKISWFYINSYMYNIISGGGGAQHAFWLAGTNKLNAGHNGNWSTVISTTSLALNTWYFGAVTFNTTNGWALYVNGIQESTSVSTTTFSGTGGVLIGAFDLGANVFSGRISNALIYNRSLSPSEILQNYNAQKSRFGL
jgi:hypothetical protein